MDFFGIPIPDAGLAFAIAVVIHIGAGLVAVIAGIVAMLSRKGGRVHIAFGRCYMVALGVVVATMVVLAVTRWPHDNHLALLGVLAAAAAVVGFVNRRRHGSDPWHILAMGVSYVLLLTAFYVDNGPFLPLWNQLPSWTYWVIPSLIGGPLIARAIVKRRRRYGVASGE